jgi:hypothetical protein
MVLTNAIREHAALVSRPPAPGTEDEAALALPALGLAGDHFVDGLLVGASDIRWADSR